MHCLFQIHISDNSKTDSYIIAIDFPCFLTSGNTHYKLGLFLADNKPFVSRRLRRLTQNLRVASPSLPSGRYTRRRGIKASVATTEPLGSQRSTKPKAKSTMRVLRSLLENQIFARKWTVKFNHSCRNISDIL